MKIFALIFAFFIASFFTKHSSKQVLSLETSNETPTVTQAVTPTLVDTVKPTSHPTSGTTNININSNVHVVNNGTGSAGKVKVTVTGVDWTYPGSADDSAATVTDWFVNKIKSQGLSTTSFVKTSANDHVLNCLAAGNGIKIQISQNSDANCSW